MRELLGELLLEAGKPADALAQFERSLKTVPNRVRSLAGAGRAAALAGNRSQARFHYQQLLLLAQNADSGRPPLKMAREYLAKSEGTAR